MLYGMKIIKPIICALLFLAVSIPHTAVGQTVITDRTLSFASLFDTIASTADTIVIFQNSTVEFNDATDGRFLLRMDSEPSADTIHVNKTVVFDRVTLAQYEGNEQAAYAFHHVVWNKPVTMNNIKTPFLMLTHSVFRDGFFINQRSNEYRMTTLHIADSEFNGVAHIERWGRNIDDIIVQDNTFETSEETPLRLIIIDDPAEFVQIQSNRFSSTDENGLVYLQVQARNTFSLAGNTFDVNAVFANTNIQGSSIIFDNVFNKYFSIQGSVLNRESTRIEWNDIRGKLVFNNHPFLPGYHADFETGIIYLNTFEDFSHPYAYRSMIPVYRMLHQIFLQSEPRRTANDMYVTMKEMEKLEAEFFYRENPTFTAFFDWQLYRFIDVFSDYGTRPAKGIIMSFYVILFFALFYFFFPNTWDTISKNKVKKRIEFFVTYFRHEKSMEESYLENNRDYITDFESFRKRIEEVKGQVPGVVIFLARPVYMLSNMNYKLTLRFLRSVDFMNRKWDEQTKLKRNFNHLLITAGLGGLVLFDLLIKMINAITLSVNTFTTLGFGDIPASGIARYMAVLEGFVGWFMLTFFSVSLIWQVLN